MSRTALLLGTLVLAGCAAATPGAGGQAAPGAVGRDNATFYGPNEATPVPEGLIGTPDPFRLAHPATSTFALPELGEGLPPVIADYVVANVTAAPGGVLVTCLAKSKLPSNETPVEFRFELLIDKLPPAPATWPVSRLAAVTLGQARVSHFRGAGTGWEGRSGSVSVSKVTRLADAMQYDFTVDARLEPSSSGPGSGPSASPDAGKSPSPPASVPPTGAPPPPPGATPSPLAVPTTTPPAPYHLSQFSSEIRVRWFGTFFTRL